MRRLSEKEEEIMTILWRLENAFVNDLLAQMSPDDRPPYNTVSSIVRKLVAEGLIGYEAFGKTHRYFPILRKEDYRSNAFRQMLDNYFNGSPAALLSFFVEEEKMDDAEVARLLDQIRKKDA